MADVGQVVFGQAGHFHDGITVHAVLQHGAGNLLNGHYTFHSSNEIMDLNALVVGLKLG
nr:MULTISPECIES: hypothetical protein [unclassified Pantoea]